MRAACLFFVCSVLLIGCSETNNPFPGYKSRSGDVVPFIMDQAIAFGARPSNTNSLPTIQAEWHYKRDADGVQLYLTGDYLSQVESFLLTAFGAPALVKTNADGLVSGGVYAAPVIGAAIQFGREDSGSTRYTQIVITRKEAFNP